MAKVSNMESIDFVRENISESFQILGFGEETYATIDRINDWGHQDVLATKTIAGSEYVPSEDNRIAIFLIADRFGDAYSTARKFSQMGILTIGILPEESLIEKYGMKPYAIEAVERMYDVVKALLDPVIGSQSYVNYDLTDLMTLLTRAELIRVVTSDGHSVKEAVSGLKQKMLHINPSEVCDAAIHLYFNRENQSLIQTDVNDAVTDFVERFAANASLCFSVGYDDAMPSDRLRIAAILSEKRNIGQ